jgi:serine/threonine protein phosphatase PrpC
MLKKGIALEGAVSTYGKFDTPHFRGIHGTDVKDAPPNADAGFFDATTGLFVADGVGNLKGADDASKFVVCAASVQADRLNIRSMDLEEAVQAVREEMLPFIDKELARYKDANTIPLAASTLAGLVLAANGLVVIGVGDSVVYGPKGKGYGMITVEQCAAIDEAAGHTANAVTNGFGGYGRPKPDDDAVDFVQGYEAQPGSKWAAVTDGFRGDRPMERMPLRSIVDVLLYPGSKTPHAVVADLEQLPLNLYRSRATVEVTYPDSVQPVRDYYVPKMWDDMTVGAVFVTAPK